MTSTQEARLGNRPPPIGVGGAGTKLGNCRKRIAIVSLPNIAHWTARRALLRGRFPQEDFGLFDRTHLRFYTRATAHALARAAGFAVVEERLAGAPLPLESRVRALRHVRGPLVRRAPELLALQFVLTLQPRSDPLP